MIKVNYNYSGLLREDRVHDILELTKYIMVEFDIYITFVDAHYLWERVSIDVFRSPWTPFREEVFDQYDLEKKQFILDCIKNYCVGG